MSTGAALTPREKRRAKREARKAEAARILPPEGVPIMLPVASVGVRFGAQTADVLITLFACFALLFLLSQAGILSGASISGLGALLFFFLRVPYYVIAELIWNGQTLGKKLMKIKVISHDGGPLTAHAIVVRNLMKEAEIFLPGTLLLTMQGADPVSVWISLAWIIMAFAIPLSNVYRQRLGDVLAGTHVVHLPVPILLKDLARDVPIPIVGRQKSFTFLPHQLDHYGAFELQTLETLLRAQDNLTTRNARSGNLSTLVSIVEKIRNKIGYADAVKPEEAALFLRAFYNAQRAHLEQRQIFGERRIDKHFRTSEKDRNSTDRGANRAQRKNS